MNRSMVQNTLSVTEQHIFLLLRKFYVILTFAKQKYITNTAE